MAEVAAVGLEDELIRIKYQAMNDVLGMSSKVYQWLLGGGIYRIETAAPALSDGRAARESIVRLRKERFKAVINSLSTPSKHLVMAVPVSRISYSYRLDFLQKSQDVTFGYMKYFYPQLRQA